MYAIFTALWRNHEGAAAVEYGLIAALIGVAAVAAFQLVGTNISASFRTIEIEL